MCRWIDFLAPGRDFLNPSHTPAICLSNQRSVFRAVESNKCHSYGDNLDDIATAVKNSTAFWLGRFCISRCKNPQPV